MIVYRDAVRNVSVRECLARHEAACAELLCRPEPEPALELLIEFGALESALADADAPLQDTVSSLQRTLRFIAVSLGHLVRDPPVEACRRHPRVLAAFRRLSRLPLPGQVALKTPEGYAYYGLHPHTYLAAAERFAADHPPGNAVCLGLRSIGTSLSALVAATLEARGWRVRSDTLRPRGDPLDRRLQVAPPLLRGWARHGGQFLVVDEGPGLSGSSFCATAATLAAHGIPDHAITFFPSWEPDGSRFLSPAARDRWPRHRRYHVPFEALFAPGRLFAAPLHDLSGGAWRDLVYAPGQRRPAVQPYHERRKYLHPGPAPRLLKFAGLGRFGRQHHARAQLLGEAGLIPPVLDLRDGFLHSRYLAGRPLPARARPTAPLLEAIARYLAFLGRHCPGDRPIPFEANRAMVEANLAGAGLAATGLADRLDRLRDTVLDAATVAGDGRMLPHEFLQTPGGLYKTDALDHHDDHFFTGCQDLAWDLAGCMVEFGLDAAAADFLLARTVHLTGDRNLPRRLPFYCIAYPAWRLGYATLAARTLAATPDGHRFAALARRYRRALLGRAGP